jgi:polyisoprenoid-binding protein YceI
MMTRLCAVLVAAAAIFDARGETLSFDFNDPRGVSNIAFSLHAPLESIKGTAKGISGFINVDPEDLASARGKIFVATNSLVVPNPLMRMHLLSKDWLNASSNPQITYEIKEVAGVRKKGPNASQVEVKGAFTLNGITKPLIAEADITYIPGKLKESSAGKLQGDLLVMRSNFSIKRSDFGIRPGEFLDKVADEIALSVSLIGAAQKEM